MTNLDTIVKLLGQSRSSRLAKISFYIGLAGLICGLTMIALIIYLAISESELPRFQIILFCALISSAPIAIISGIVAIVMIRKNHLSRRKYALAGIVIGILILLLILLVILITESSQQRMYFAKTGIHASSLRSAPPALRSSPKET